MNHQKIYYNIIERAISEKRIKNKGIYYESHHVLPKCLGGKGTARQWKTHPNIVLLTAREHFICHRLLILIYPDSLEIKLAANIMSTLKKRFSISNRTYEQFKITRKEFMKNNSYAKGNIQSEESKRKISESKRGTKYKPHKRTPMSDETKKKISDAKRKQR